MRVLLTGGAGFVGHHVLEHLLKTTDWTILLMDRLDLSGNLNRVHEVLDSVQVHHVEYVRSRVKWVYHDFKAPISDALATALGRVDGIIHCGASTHVDRSIVDPMSFVLDNVVGTANILEWMRVRASKAWMVYFSTDEVFGPAPKGVKYLEWSRYNSTNPYAATKAGGEELCLAYANTYGLDIRITHCMNIFGERQHKEKFIPLVIHHVLHGKTVYIHANAEKTKAGSRFYIHARNVADALMFVINMGVRREKYNIVGAKEVDNLELATMIAEFIGKPLKHELVDFHSSRPGHDLRYALDGERLNMKGWKPPVDFDASLRKTVEWTLSHPQWL